MTRIDTIEEIVRLKPDLRAGEAMSRIDTIEEIVRLKPDLRAG